MIPMEEYLTNLAVLSQLHGIAYTYTWSRVRDTSIPFILLSAINASNSLSEFSIAALESVNTRRDFHRCYTSDSNHHCQS